MTRSRKDQPDKNAWSWVENCDSQTLNINNLRTAYRIKSSRCSVGNCRRNCKTNPHCLSNLGEHKWISEDSDDVGNCEISDPEKERRKVELYAGLKNLGATCYVNSLLQLWFHNLNFRKAIFMWNPREDQLERENASLDTDSYFPSSIIGHLQVVFALLQHGKQRYVDPTDFITCLKLDTSMQQDAQEFSKLFLSMLETYLNDQSCEEIRDLIKNNFSGQYSYITRCLKCHTESACPSTFYELDLNIKGHKTIQDSLKEFMMIEMLQGDNKYHCSMCKDKQDAQRFISLTSLPPVLNLQLMRFVFDKNAGFKKKLNSYIQFPEVLDMSEFFPHSEGKDVEYNLSAVLVHSGRSANSGHYVAHICDSSAGVWYKFNDENVEKIEGKKLKLGSEDEYEDKKVKAPRVAKGYHQSSNAYMLVYTSNKLKKDSSDLSDSNNQEWTLQPYLQNLVEQKNGEFENWVQQVACANVETLGKTKVMQVEMASLITLLPAELDGDDCDAIVTDWLTSWLDDPGSVKPIDNSKVICPHSKLDPNLLANVKYISNEIADKLYERYEGGPRLRSGDFECFKCVASRCFWIRIKNKSLEDMKEINNKLKNKMESNEQGYWVGKSSIRGWRRMLLDTLPVIPLKEQERLLGYQDKWEENFRCGDTSSVKRYGHDEKHTLDKRGLSQDSFDKLKECYSISGMDNGDRKLIHNLLKEVLEECKDYSVQNGKLESPIHVEPFQDNVTHNSNLLNGWANPVEQIDASTNTATTAMECDEQIPSQQQLKTVRKESHSEEISSEGQSPQLPMGSSISTVDSNDGKRIKDDAAEDSSEGETKFNEDVLCQHGNLCIEENNRKLVPPEVWHTFKRYFPYAKEFLYSTQPCGLCKSIASEDEVAKGMYKKEAGAQKELLMDLYLDKNRPQLQPDDNGKTYYIVNREFINSWRKFIRDAGKKEPPYSMKNQSILLCEMHLKLLYSLNAGVSELNNLLVLVTEKEWEILRSICSVDVEISVQCLIDGSIVTSPDVCEPCMLSRLEYEEKAQLCYDRAKIYIKVINDEADATSNDENWPPAKRSKLNSNLNSGSSNNNNNNNEMANGNSMNNNENENENISNGRSPDGNNDELNIEIQNIINNNNKENNNISNGNNNNNTNGNDGNCNNRTSNSNGNVTGNNAITSTMISSVHQNASTSTNTDGVRRSARSRRVRDLKPITVSSDLTLLELKKRICGLLNVAPMDQHLYTMDGRNLNKNGETLADLAIYPETTLNLKVDEPCDGATSEEYVRSITPEHGFKGTGLLSN